MNGDEFSEEENKKQSLSDKMVTSENKLGKKEQQILLNIS